MGKKFVGLDGLKHFWTKAKTWITGQITAEVTAKIAELVANAPEDLDTLKEISDWITEHANSAAEMNTQIIKNQDDIKLLQNKTVESCPVDVVEKGNMHAVTSNAVYDVLGGLGEKITSYMVGNGYTFIGTIIKVGKIVFVDGNVTNTISNNYGTIIGDIPMNNSGVNKDLYVMWISNNLTSIAGYSILSFDNGNYGLSVGIGAAPIGKTHVSFSYITN